MVGRVGHPQHQHLVAQHRAAARLLLLPPPLPPLLLLMLLLLVLLPPLLLPLVPERSEGPPAEGVPAAEGGALVGPGEGEAGVGGGHHLAAPQAGAHLASHRHHRHQDQGWPRPWLHGSHLTSYLKSHNNVICTCTIYNLQVTTTTTSSTRHCKEPVLSPAGSRAWDPGPYTAPSSTQVPTILLVTLLTPPTSPLARLRHNTHEWCCECVSVRYPPATPATPASPG